VQFRRAHYPTRRPAPQAPTWLQPQITRISTDRTPNPFSDPCLSVPSVARLSGPLTTFPDFYNRPVGQSTALPSPQARVPFPRGHASAAFPGGAGCRREPEVRGLFARGGALGTNTRTSRGIHAARTEPRGLKPAALPRDVPAGTDRHRSGARPSFLTTIDDSSCDRAKMNRPAQLVPTRRRVQLN